MFLTVFLCFVLSFFSGRRQLFCCLILVPPFFQDFGKDDGDDEHDEHGIP